MVRIEHLHMLRIALHKRIDPRVILVPIAADAFFAVRRIVLGKRARSEQVVMPALGRLPGPVIRGQRHTPVEPAAEAGDYLVPRPFQAYNPDVRFGGDGFFEIRQVGRRHVAQPPRRTMLPKPRKPRPDDAPRALLAITVRQANRRRLHIRHPRQQGRLVV